MIRGTIVIVDDTSVLLPYALSSLRPLNPRVYLRGGFRDPSNVVKEGSENPSPIVKDYILSTQFLIKLFTARGGWGHLRYMADAVLSYPNYYNVRNL